MRRQLGAGGPQVVAAPFGGNGRRRKGGGGGFKDSNKQFEWKTSSHVQTLVDAASLVPDGGADSRLPVLAAPPAHAAVTMVAVDRGSFGSPRNRRCQACLLITPSGREESQSRVPSRINGGREGVRARVCCQTRCCWGPPTCRSLFRRISLRRSRRVCGFMSAGEASEDQMQMRPCRLFPEANC